MAPWFLNRDTLPSPIFTTKQFLPGTPVHSLYDLDLQEDGFAAISSPLFNGQASRLSRHLQPAAISTYLESLGLFCKIDGCDAQFQADTADNAADVEDSPSQTSSRTSSSQSFDLWSCVRLDVLPTEGELDWNESCSIHSHGSLSLRAVDGRADSRPSMSIPYEFQNLLVDRQTVAHPSDSGHAPMAIPSTLWKEPPIIPSSKKPTLDRTVIKQLAEFRIKFGPQSPPQLSPPVSPKTNFINLSGFPTYVRPQSPRSRVVLT